MNSLSVSVRLRPIRFAFLVRPDDTRRVQKIFQINTCLWGGKFNPIVPYFKQVPSWWERKGYRFESAKQILNGYLDFFEPDFVVEAEKGMAGGLGFHTDRVLQLSDLLLRAGDSRKEGFGFSVNDLYHDLYKREFQFARRHQHNIVHVKPKDASFAAFVACVFGAFPTQTNLRYFEKKFKDVFDPRLVALDAESLVKLYKSRQTSALRISHAKLDVDYNEHSDPALFILNAHESRDLIDFWNLRAIRRNILAMPVQWISELSPFCKDFILRNHRPLPGNPNGVMIQPISIFARSIPDKEIDEIYKAYLEVDKKGANCIQHWYPTFWKPTPEIMVRTNRPTLKASGKRIDVPIDLEKPVIKFDTLWPEFAAEYGNRHRVANVIAIEGWGDNDQIATAFPCNYRNPSYPKFRLGRETLLPTTEGLVIFPEYKNLPERWELVRGTDAINAWFNENKITATLSDAGRATQQVIQTLEGFWGVGRIASAGIVQTLNEMSRKPLTHSMHYDKFRQKIQKAVGKDIWRHKEFETLVERKAVELGLEIKCTKCGSWGWHPINRLDYSLTCDLCLQKFNFPITNPIESKYSRWAYRVIGPFALPDYARGGYASALAIRFFSSVIGKINRVDVTWSAGQELVLPGNKKSEADFILWYQRKHHFGTDRPTEIVFGEAKSFGKDVFKEEEIKKAKLLAEAFPGTVLVFAAMKEAEELSKEEVLRIRKFAEWGREYNKDRSWTRAPVIVLTGTELFAPYSLEESWKAKGGKRASLMAPAWISIRTDNLRILANLTQQAYLDMPSYDTWWGERRKRRLERRKASPPEVPISQSKEIISTI